MLCFMVQLYLCNKQNAGVPITSEQVLNCTPFRRAFEGGPEDLAKAKIKKLNWHGEVISQRDIQETEKRFYSMT